MKINRCPYCNCKEGEFHKPECYLDQCPFCGSVSDCRCSYELLDLGYDMKKKYFGLPKDVYYNGLTDEMKKEWEKILEKKGRVPYIEWPTSVCAMCGTKEPKFFKVPDEEWQYYIHPGMQHKIVCWNCYHKIKSLVDMAQGKYDPKPVYFQWKGRFYGMCRGCGDDRYVKEKMRYSDANIVYLCKECWDLKVFDRDD